MASSRIKNSITNILTGAFGQILNIVLNFALRTVFLYSLGKEYAGINGVLSGVLQVLNLANLGIDGAIVYAMYKPLAEKNTEQAKALVAFYRRAYRIIGSVIVVVGVALIPVLPYLLKDSTELVDIRIAAFGNRVFRFPDAVQPAEAESAERAHPHRVRPAVVAGDEGVLPPERPYAHPVRGVARGQDREGRVRKAARWPQAHIGTAAERPPHRIASRKAAAPARLLSQNSAQHRFDAGRSFSSPFCGGQRRKGARRTRSA
mgnify:CR=1 FL=1